MYKVSAQEQEVVGLKTKTLQLNCESKDIGRGFCPHSLNPRLTNVTRLPQLPVMGLHMMNTTERVSLQQTISQNVGSLPRKKNQVKRREYLLPFGDKAVLNNRYTLPSSSGYNSPTKAVSSMVLQVSPSITPRKTKTVPFTGAAIQSRCSCRHRRWHRSEDHKTITLESSSNNVGRISLNRIRGFKSDTRVKPKDMSPPKKQTLTNGMSAVQLKNKSKRANVLPSDSSSSIQVQVKRRKQSTTKIPSCTKHKSQTKEEQVAQRMNSERMQNLQTKPNVNVHVPLLIEVASENHLDTGRELTEEMDVDLEDKERLPVNSANKTESIDSISIRSSADLRQTASPQLLKVNAEQKMALFSLTQMFQKLDTDCDGHISFTELEKSLPHCLTKKHINYIKKIYAFACESTYFGVEEFLATHQICNLLTTSSNPLVLNALNSLDSYSLDSWLKTYTESFSKADKDHTGVLDVLSFQNMLASMMNVHPDSIILHNILGGINKSEDDTISGVELLACIPYLAVVTPRDT